MKKNSVDEMFKRIMKKDKPPKSAPVNSLTFDIVLFSIIDTPRRRIKSNKKFIKKT